MILYGCGHAQSQLPFVCQLGRVQASTEQCENGMQGVLNVWHLVHYQRFYNSLVAQLVPTAEQASQSLVARVSPARATA